MQPGSTANTFRILYVCTGNLCRSPSAELLTTAWLAKNLGEQPGVYEVASAGTHGLTGHPMDAEASRALEQHGCSAEGFQARELEPAQVVSADLVVGLARQHRAAAVRMAPSAMRRTFTLRELDRLVQAVDALPDDALPDESSSDGSSSADRARDVVAQAAALRGTLPPVPPEDDDVADPIGRPVAAHAQVCEQIAASVHRVMIGLAS